MFALYLCFPISVVDLNFMTKSYVSLHNLVPLYSNLVYLQLQTVVLNKGITTNFPFKSKILRIDTGSFKYVKVNFPQEMKSVEC
jgi:hypothetical protein